MIKKIDRNKSRVAGLVSGVEAGFLLTSTQIVSFFSIVSF